MHNFVQYFKRYCLSSSGCYNFFSFASLKEKLEVERKKINKKREKMESLKMGKYKWAEAREKEPVLQYCGSLREGGVFVPCHLSKLSGVFIFPQFFLIYSVFKISANHLPPPSLVPNDILLYFPVPPSPWETLRTGAYESTFSRVDLFLQRVSRDFIRLNKQITNQKRAIILDASLSAHPRSHNNRPLSIY